MLDSSFGSRQSQSSNQSRQRKAFIDGDIVQTLYDYRLVSPSSQMTIIVPPLIQNRSILDKNVRINYIHYACSLDNITLTQLRAQQYRIIAQNQRNSFDSNGLQTNVIGYMHYDDSKKLIIGDSFQYEQDAKLSTVIQIQKYDFALQQWTNLNVQANLYEYIYLDVTVDYD